jgi:DNA-binding NarL/FixJ family response regulator
VKPRVLLADDHQLILDALGLLLADECEVVGAVADGRELLRAATELRPDVVVVDVSMPRLNGLDAAEQLRQRMPEVRIIIVTMNTDVHVAARAIDFGVLGFLLKSSAGSELLVAIRSVMRGETYITKKIPRDQVDALMRGELAVAKRELTPRQREVLQLLAEGRSMKQVASELGLTTRTVAFHKYRIMRSTGTESDAGLFQIAVREGLLPLDS